MAIGIAVKVTRISSPEGYPTLSGSSIEVGESIQDKNTTIPSGLVHKLVAVSFAKDDLKHLFVLSSVDATLYTNGVTGPTDTYALKAGRPFVWNVSDGVWANPFSANVTSFYVFAETAGTFRARILT